MAKTAYLNGKDSLLKWQRQLTYFAESARMVREAISENIGMEMEDKKFILESARRLERWENTPRPVPDDYADKNRDELVKLTIYQRERMEEAEAIRRKEHEEKEAEAIRRKEHEESAGRISALTTQVSELTDKLSALTEQLRKNNESLSAMTEQVFGLMRQLREKDEKIAELQGTVKVRRKNLLGRKSQKGAQF